MTFKDLKKRVSLELLPQQQYSNLFERLQNKPSWIWNIEEHKQEDIKTNGNCCFNHIIGLPTKERIEKPFFDYQKILYDALLSINNDNNNNVSILTNNQTYFNAKSKDKEKLKPSSSESNEDKEEKKESKEPNYHEDEILEEKQEYTYLYLQ